MVVLPGHPATFEVVNLQRLLEGLSISLDCETIVWLTAVGRPDQRLLVNHTEVLTPVEHHVDDVVVYGGLGLSGSPWQAQLVAGRYALSLAIQTGHFRSFLAPKHQLLLLKHRVAVL